VTIAETEAGEALQEVLAHADDPAPFEAEREPLRFSRLKMIGKSPAHFRGAAGAEGSHLDVGTAAHSLILGGRPVIFYPGPVRRGKAWDEFQAAHDDAIILTVREHTIAKRIAESVKSNRDAMRVLEGVREETFHWKQMGWKCRGTPDVRGDGFVTELKTGETSDPRRFPWKMRNFCYHGQLAFYSDGMAFAGLEPPREQYIVAVESVPPFVCTVFRVSPRAIDQGRKLIHLWFETLNACEGAKAWPGYVQSVVDLELPGDEFELGDAGDAL
jgi:hypothetical protein